MIIVTDLKQDGATVNFAYDAEIVAAFKAAFPKARWNRNSRVWGIPGKLAYARALKWASVVEDQKRAAEKASEDELFDAVACVETRRKEIQNLGAHIREGGRQISLWMPKTYIESVTAICRSLPNAKWSDYSHAWQWEIRKPSDIAAILDGLQKIRLVYEAREAANQQHAAARAKAAAQENAARQERRANRILVSAEAAPKPGSEIQVGGRTVIVESLGKTWRLDDEDACVYGLPPSAGGALVRYAYYLEAASV